MVQIPIYTSESSPKLTAPVTSGVPNLVGAAMLPYEQVSRLGNTILECGHGRIKLTSIVISCSLSLEDFSEMTGILIAIGDRGMDGLM